MKPIAYVYNIIITKLQIYFFQGVSVYEIYSAFSQFGLVEDFRELSGGRYVVTMCISIHLDVDRLFQGVAYEYHLEYDWTTDHTHPSDQRMLALEPKPQQSSDRSLEVLNDDCLREIFERPEIDLMDLAALGNVCERFNAIAVRVLPKKLPVDTGFFNNVDLWRVEECFRTFGDQIGSIDLSAIRSDDADIVLQLVVKYCKRITNLGCVVHYPSTLSVLRPLMKQLEQFKLVNADNALPRLFDPDVQYPLKKLHCISWNTIIMPEQQFPQLTELYLKSWEHDRDLPEFFLLNPQLEVLTLQYFFYTHIRNDHWFQNLLNLRELNVHSDMLNLNNGLALSIIHLVNLEKLGIRISPVTRRSIDRITSFVFDHKYYAVSLTLGGWMNSWTNAICSVPNITDVKFVGNLPVSDTGLLRLTTHLKFIDVKWSDCFPKDIICDALKSSHRLKKANFKCYIKFCDFFETVDETSMNAIDDIRRKKKIQLLIKLKLLMDGNILDCEVSDLSRTSSFFFRIFR